MSESAKDYLNRFLSEVDGIVGVYVCDKDGVIMTSAFSPEEVFDQAMQPYVASAFLSSIQQSSKLDLGNLEWMVTRYQEMVHLILVFIPLTRSQSGAILAMELSIRPLLTRLAPLVFARLQNENLMCPNSDGQYFRV
ncbi:ragulator complex protein LAMTOR3 [Paragonimus westermani]|uniref:Ragulator complex protein LAMTOR3 n=1 Tax=Paragonimus westermani TaxID=34504 RepID=A0A5J4ND98_9TREM|nr:ragulator complex protein LAMTOR3 [Paragonimus westermani]